MGRLSLQSIVAAAVGTSLEWFDFTVYVFVSPYIAKLFFPASTYHGLMITFAIFAAGYLMRPLGGIFFGQLGDRIGRRKVLIIALLCMSGPMLVTGLLPTTESIGIAAPILLLLMRMMQGFSVGGEYTGVLVMLIEQAPRNLRGMVTALGTFVSGSGVLLSSLTVAILTSVLSQQQMLHWGWRIPFLFGFLLALFAFILQLGMTESPQFEKLKQTGQLIDKPLQTVLLDHPRAIFLVMVLAGFLGIAYYLCAAFLPTYLVTVLQVDHHQAMLVTTLSAAVYAFTAPFWGYMTDRVGRKPILLLSIIGLVLLAYPSFRLLTSGSLLAIYIAAVVLMLLVSAGTAAFVTTINELFPTQQRFSGMSTGYNVGNAIFGGTAPLVATALIEWSGMAIAPCFYLMVAGIVTCIFVWKMPETRGLQ